MAGPTPETAVDAFFEHIRSTLACIIDGTAFGSGHALGAEHVLTLYTEGQAAPNLARLSTHGGNGDRLFRVAHRYTVVALTADDPRGRYSVRPSFYQYRILDREEHKITVYHWEPEGVSPVRIPHMHMPAAPSMVLPQRRESPMLTKKTHLGKLHFPTGQIVLEEIAELLIREFRVDPKLNDWAAILQRNRESVGRVITW